MIRVAAVGDLHFGKDLAGTLSPHLQRLGEDADLLVLAGDLSRRGRLEEAEALAHELSTAPVPIVAVLGNHDYESDQEEEFTAMLEDAGVVVLEGTRTVVVADGVRVGVAGTIGFGGGFPGASCADFGEREMKAFVARTRRLAAGLERALGELDADVRIALLHYSPIPETLVGERLEIYPFLGSYLLAEAIDRSGADIVFHGHAHHGVERGMTPAGIPVRNVAQPVIRHPFNVYRFRGRRLEGDAAVERSLEATGR
ncbi:MAG: metallophosphoesterase [Actinomycetota bacterium]|nr:metallophosphoesterase [Actinomycetota bacterium]